MSSTNAPFGLRPAFHPSGLDRASALANGIQAVSTSGNVSAGYATNILKGQPVKMNTGGYIVVAAAGDAFLGAFQALSGLIRQVAAVFPTTGLPTSLSWLVPSLHTSITIPTSFMKFNLTALWLKPLLATKLT